MYTLYHVYWARYGIKAIYKSVDTVFFVGARQQCCTGVSHARIECGVYTILRAQTKKLTKLAGKTFRSYFLCHTGRESIV